MALQGIKALEDFIQEIGLPTRLSEMRITDKEVLKMVAESSNISAGCCKHLTHEEIYDILIECL